MATAQYLSVMPIQPSLDLPGVISRFSASSD
jgi:hypothetical protein